MIYPVDSTIQRLSLLGVFGIRDFKQNGGEIRDQIESMHGMPNTALGITGLSKNLGRDDEIEKPYCRGPTMVVSVDLKVLKVK